MNPLNFVFPPSYTSSWPNPAQSDQKSPTESTSSSSSTSPPTDPNHSDWQKFMDQTWTKQLAAIQLNFLQKMKSGKSDGKHPEGKKNKEMEKNANIHRNEGPLVPPIMLPTPLSFYPGNQPLMPCLRGVNDDHGEEKEEAIHLRTQHSRRRQRVLFTPEQIQTLESRFENTKYLTPSERDRLATKLGLTSTQIKIWFQNRRYKRRRIDQDLALQSVGLGLGVPLMDSMMNEMGTPHLHDLIFQTQ